MSSSKSHTIAILLAHVCTVNIELAKAKDTDPLYQIIVGQRDTIISLIDNIQNDQEVRVTNDKGS